MPDTVLLMYTMFPFDTLAIFKISFHIPFIFQVFFCFISRILVQLGSCINPFIYATTIPGFKQIVKNSLINYGFSKGEVSILTMETTNNLNTKTKDNTKQGHSKSQELINPDNE